MEFEGGRPGLRRAAAFPEKIELSSEVRVSICSLIWAARCRAAAVNCVRSMRGILSKGRKWGKPYYVVDEGELSTLDGLPSVLFAIAE